MAAGVNVINAARELVRPLPHQWCYEASWANFVDGGDAATIWFQVDVLDGERMAKWPVAAAVDTHFPMLDFMLWQDDIFGTGVVQGYTHVAPAFPNRRWFRVQLVGVGVLVASYRMIARSFCVTCASLSAVGGNAEFGLYVRTQ